MSCSQLKSNRIQLRILLLDTELTEAAASPKHLHVCDDIQSKSTSTLLLCLSVSRSLYTSALRSMDRFDLFVSQAKTLIIQRWRSAIVDQSSSINSPQKVGSRSCARILAYWRSPTVCSLQSAAWRPSSFLGCMLSHLEQLRIIQMQYNTL